MKFDIDEEERRWQDDHAIAGSVATSGDCYVLIGVAS
jgi:hypothetical protein